MSAGPSPLPSQLPATFGNYELLERVQGGGMSAVYRARTRIGKTVAIKILKSDETDSETRSRFYDEARTAAALNHPNIVSVYDLGEIDGNLFMVMEYLEGRDLGDALNDNRLPQLSDQLKVLMDVARALRHVHQHGILHRDIKPGNIFLCSTGQVKLIDFGIAKSAVSVSKTRVGYTVGTLHFMAPEQVQGFADNRTDIYAFGLLIYQVLTRLLPVKGDSVQVVFYNILHEPLDLTPLEGKNLPDGLVQLIKDCSEKEPDRRPQSFVEVCNRLEAVAAQVISSGSLAAAKAAEPSPPAEKSRQAAPSPPSVPETAEPATTSRWILAGISVALAVIAAGAAVFLWTRSNQSEARSQPQEMPKVLAHSTGDMVLVSAGEFLFGGDKDVRTLPDFYIDKTEVTNAAFAEYCRTRGCKPHEGSADRPVVKVTVDIAREFCEAAGKRLPTALEWEKAARGTSGASYPWGNAEEDTRANVSAGSATGELKPVGSFPGGASPYGALDMMGNAWEIVEDARQPTDKELAHARDLGLTPAPTRNERWIVVYGGSFAGPLAHAWDSAIVPARLADDTIGFRCAKSAQSVQPAK